MKKAFFVFILNFLFNLSFGQDISTELKLHNISVAIGVANSVTNDSMRIKYPKEEIGYKEAQQLSKLLKAAECYNNKDYENCSLYLRSVAIKFKNNDYNNLKYFLQISCFANLQEAKLAAKYFYVANKSKLVSSENMQLINSEIRKNFTKDIFDDALDNYYYYHARFKIIAEIKFNE